METQDVRRILVTAGAESRAEQVLSLLRRGDVSLTASEAQDSEQLTHLLDTGQWDLILAFTDNQRLAPEHLLTYLQEIQRDIPCIVIGDGEENPQPLLARGAAAVVDGNSLDHDRGRLQLFHYASREMQHLHERRDNRRLAVGLEELEQRYQRLLETTSDAIACVQDGMHIYSNPAWLAFFGYQGNEQMLGVPFLDLVAEDDVDKVRDFLRRQDSNVSARCEFRARSRDGSEHPAVLESAAVPYNGHRSLQLRIRPVLGNIQRENAETHQERHDLVTELLTPYSMREALMHAISDAVYSDRSSTVLLVELQNLNEMARVLGKSDTALLLADIGRLLSDMCPEGALAGRTGAHEFCLLLPGSGENVHREMLTRLEGLSGELRSLLPPNLSLAAATGLAVITNEAPGADTILSRARHNQILRQQQPVELGSVEESNLMLRKLHKALDEELLTLVYQPVVSLREDGIERYEVRTRMPDNGAVMFPPQFLEIANQHGLGERIDRYVISEALKVLQKSENPRLRFILNLTQNSVTSSTFLPWLLGQMHEHRIPGDRLVLQISEIDVAASPEAIEHLCRQLDEPDISASVAHFGCNLDPMHYLARVPVRYAKLDRSLLLDIDKDSQQHDKLQTVVSSLHARGIRVIAPMIDRIEMLPLLWQSQVNFVQGNCLQAPSDSLDFSFLQDEEITSYSF